MEFLVYLVPDDVNGLKGVFSLTYLFVCYVLIFSATKQSIGVLFVCCFKIVVSCF